MRLWNSSVESMKTTVSFAPCTSRIGGASLLMIGRRRCLPHDRFNLRLSRTTDKSASKVSVHGCRPPAVMLMTHVSDRAGAHNCLKLAGEFVVRAITFQVRFIGGQSDGQGQRAASGVAIRSDPVWIDVVFLRVGPEPPNRVFDVVQAGGKRAVFDHAIRRQDHDIALLSQHESSSRKPVVRATSPATAVHEDNCRPGMIDLPARPNDIEHPAVVAVPVRDVCLEDDVVGGFRNIRSARRLSDGSGYSNYTENQKCRAGISHGESCYQLASWSVSSQT